MWWDEIVRWYQPCTFQSECIGSTFALITGKLTPVMKRGGLCMCGGRKKREMKRSKFMYERRRDGKRGNKEGKLVLPFPADPGSRQPRRVWIFVEAWKCFLGRGGSVAVFCLDSGWAWTAKNRSVIESQRVSLKNVALSCMFVHLVSRVSEWRTWEERDGEGRGKPPLPPPAWNTKFTADLIQGKLWQCKRLSSCHQK